jgi:hypothetical protein
MIIINGWSGDQRKQLTGIIHGYLGNGDIIGFANT